MDFYGIEIKKRHFVTIPLSLIMRFYLTIFTYPYKVYKEVRPKNSQNKGLLLIVTILLILLLGIFVAKEVVPLLPLPKILIGITTAVLAGFGLVSLGRRTLNRFPSKYDD